VIKVSVFEDDWTVTTPVVVNTFAGGEVNVSLDSEIIERLKDSNIHSSEGTYATVIAKPKTPTDLIALMLTVDAIRRVRPTYPINLAIPYFPYARQDRVCNEGEALSVAVIAKMINALDVGAVIIFDPHSPVTPALIDRVKVITPKEIIERAIGLGFIAHQKELTYMAPDQGAYKRVLDIASDYDIGGDFLWAVKERDPKTMEIKEVKINGDVKDRHILIVDDICDGGRTFLEIGKQLRALGAASIQLYITHGIFSYGITALCELFDGIVTTDSFHELDQSTGQPVDESLRHPKLRWIKAA
jgi:ribose-phosphate pyrophosphokinase